MAAGIFLVLLAAAENSVLPWAPFFVLTAAATILIPLRAGVVAFSPMRRPLWRSVLIALGLTFAMFVAQGLMALAIAAMTGALDPGPNAALAAVFETAAGRFGTDSATVRTLYLGFVLLWAGFGEELFYRGAVHASLRARHGFLVAAVVSAALFSVRHAPQLLLLWPDYPAGAALVWMAHAFLFGIVMSAMYEATGSLTAPVIVHYLVNLLALAG